MSNTQNNVYKKDILFFIQKFKIQEEREFNMYQKIISHALPPQH